MYDAIVLGVGGMGSAAVYHLAKRNLNVLGLERFDIPHSMGSSHGLTRIIRLAYFEDPTYVPLLRRAYELWRDLQREAEEQLLYITGSVDVGRPGTQVLEGSLTSCAAHDIPHEVLDQTELMRRFPAYRLPPDFQAVLQPDGGFLLSERCIVAHVERAQALGADIRAREKVVGWEASGDIIRVTSERGTYEAKRLVICAGPWAGQLVPALQRHAVPERQVLGWFQPRVPAHFKLGNFPVFNFTADEGHYYGLPVFEIPGMKLGRYHHFQEDVDPDTLDRECHDRDERALREFVERYFPDAAGPTMALKSCMFTNTPDEHFVIDCHPDFPQIVIAAGFSGHGFKFASVVGEILADLAQDGETRHNTSRFSIDRFK